MLISTNRKKGIKSKIDISLILSNHYSLAQNLTVKNGENNGLLAGVPFLSPSRARMPTFPFPFKRLPGRLDGEKAFTDKNNFGVLNWSYGWDKIKEINIDQAARQSTTN